MRIGRPVIILPLLRMAVAVYSAWSAVPEHEPSGAMDFSALPHASITVDSRRGQLAIELPAVDLPAGSGHDGPQPPACVGEFPVSGAIYQFHAEVIDEKGRVLPADLLHHVNVMDPSERELFLPISRRILASGRETGVVRLPWMLFGARVHAGERILANAMLHNPTAVSYHGVRVRMVMSYVPERRPWPFFSVVPWQLDVAFPVGDKSFDLPPGRSERSYEGSPAVPGDLVVIGGHMHEYGRTIEFWDATTNRLLWHGEPAPASQGEPKAVPLGRLYGLTRMGMHITPEHRYRVRVIYENPTGHVVEMGGMGVVGGLFVPDRGAIWPTTETSDSLYRQDLRHFLGLNGSANRGDGMSSHIHSHADR